jgi:hypothetical protein
MDGAPFGDRHQPFPLGVIEIAYQLDVAIDLTDESFLGLTVGAVFGVNP